MGKGGIGSKVTGFTSSPLPHLLKICLQMDNISNCSGGGDICILYAVCGKKKKNNNNPPHFLFARHRSLGVIHLNCLKPTNAWKRRVVVEMNILNHIVTMSVPSNSNRFDYLDEEEKDFSRKLNKVTGIWSINNVANIRCEIHLDPTAMSK